MYGITEGEPFQVFARRQAGAPGLVIRFECKEGMGILGIRMQGRSDPQPSVAYEEEGIDPSSLRVGRFVHVLANGQRQSYALSRITSDVAGELPSDAWAELKPQTEYGFRYLVVPEVTVAAAAVPSPPASPAALVTPAPATPTRPTAPDAPPPLPPSQSMESVPRSASLQVPVAPPLADSMLAGLTRDQAVDYLKGEMARVHQLQQQVEELGLALARSKSRERDLLNVLAKWQDEA